MANAHAAGGRSLTPRGGGRCDCNEFAGPLCWYRHVARGRYFQLRPSLTTMAFTLSHSV